jgi:cytochrome c oxidase accessory protein FixG
MWVERRIEGDRNARIKLDAEPWGPRKRRLRLTKHVAWIAIAMATGGAWIMYFNDAPTIAWQMLTLQAGVTVYFFFGLFTLTTYMLAGFAREQVCTYMCPWPRFQGAMLDDQSLVISYRDWRGEPRGKLKEEGHGDCVDCGACAHVCPTGIDIRDGQQLQCIGCGLCVDACDDVMRKLDRPEGLVAFETLANLAASQAATARMAPDVARLNAGMAVRRMPRLLRPRTLMYAAVLSLVAAVMVGAFVLRETLSVSVLRDRAPLFVQLSDGGVRNAFTIKVVNKTHDVARYSLVLEGAPGVTILAQGAEADADGRPVLSTRADGITEWRVLATVPPNLRLPANLPISFHLHDARGHDVAHARSVLLGPGP